MASIRRDLEKRAQKAIIEAIFENQKKQRADWTEKTSLQRLLQMYAFFSTRNAFMIGGVLIASGVVTALSLILLPLGVPFILAGGGFVAMLGLAVAEVMFLATSLNDEKLHAQAVADMLQTDPEELKFDANVVKDKHLKEQLAQAIEYWSLIDDRVNQVPAGVLRDKLENTTKEVTNWLRAVYKLAQRIEGMQDNEIVQRDLKRLPDSLARDRQRLMEEDDEAIIKRIEQTISQKERQLQILESLEDQKDKAAFQLDGTISSLGTIYSQLLLVSDKEETGSSLDRLQEEITEQVHRLDDLSEAMDEVYQAV